MHFASLKTFTIDQLVALVRRTFPDVSKSTIRFLERERLLPVRSDANGPAVYTRDDVDRIVFIRRLQALHKSLPEIHWMLQRRDTIGTPQMLNLVFLEAMRAGDIRAAKQVIARASEVGVPLRVMMFEVLAPALVSIGNLWEADEIDVGREHMVSAVIRDLISSVNGYVVPAIHHGAKAVAVCASGERHELGLRMLTSLLEEYGWTVYFLGADTPVESAVRMTIQSGADALIVSIGTPEDVQYVEKVDRLVRDQGLKVKIVVGGRGANTAHERLASFDDYVAGDAMQAVDYLAEFATALQPA